MAENRRGRGRRVSILLGNANGTFQATVGEVVGEAPDSVAVGDFNADGWTDLAVASRYPSNNVSILLGNGNGTFQAMVKYAADNGPKSVAVGDFNADGRPDLAVANIDSNNVSILLGNANGTFQGAINFALPGGASRVAVGDFNADGRPDLAVAVSGTTVSVLLNTTPNVMVSQQPVPVFTCPSGTAAFSVTATGTGPFTYQWQWQASAGAAWVDVLDGPNADAVGGQVRFTANNARTATVTVALEPGGGSGTSGSHWVNRCVVSNALGSVTSNPATLTICPADFNCDGFVTGEDFDAYVAAFELDGIPADFDRNGFVTGEDFDAFVLAFEAGC